MCIRDRFIIALIFGALFGDDLAAQFVIVDVSYASQTLKIVENLGLIFFVSAVGFIAGPNFFKNLKTNYKSYVLLGLVIIIAAVSYTHLPRARPQGSNMIFFHYTGRFPNSTYCCPACISLSYLEPWGRALGYDILMV